MSIIDTTDLPQSVRDAVDADTLALLVAGLNAKALRVAPCLADEDVDFRVIDEARLILLGTVKRWAESGSGAYSQQTAGPFSVSVDTRQRGGGYSMWPSEEDALRLLCSGGTSGGAYMIDMTGRPTTLNPLSGAVINSNLGAEPMGEWSDEPVPYVGEV